MKCPCCGKVLAKKYRRGMARLQWEMLQTSNWMMAWGREHARAVEAEKKLNKSSKSSAGGAK